MKAQCPHCHRHVEIIDVGPQASSWFAGHNRPGTRDLCDGSWMVYEDREPRPEALADEIEINDDVRTRGDVNS